MSALPKSDQMPRRLMQLGLILFLLGLVTGFALPVMENPRMGLSSHLEGLMNGMLLVVAGLVWPHLVLPRMGLRLAFLLLVYGAFANWLVTLLAAIWGGGHGMMPIAAGGRVASPLQEAVISGLLVSLSLAMIGGILLCIIGLGRKGSRP